MLSSVKHFFEAGEILAVVCVSPFLSPQCHIPTQENVDVEFIQGWDFDRQVIKKKKRDKLGY